MLLSVIIPFYHVERYLDACLARVMQLPPEQCEVLLVDDCGQDGSAAIAQAYAQRYSNFRVLKRAQNGGLSAARNTGLEAAKGEYVYFLDSDDLPEPKPLWHLAERAKAERLDVIKGRFAFYDDETGACTPGPLLTDAGCETGGALFARQCRAGQYEPMVWQCIYRRSFLADNHLIMAEGLLFEDELFQAPALLAAKRVAVSEETILLYRQRAGSIMKSFARSSRWCDSYLEVCRRLRTLADRQMDEAPKRALKKRVGQIALSVAKNIPAYGLPPEVASEALAFLAAHRAELAGYACRSGDALVAVQGMLLAASPRLFIACYKRT